MPCSLASLKTAILFIISHTNHSVLEIISVSDKIKRNYLTYSFSFD